MSVFCAIDILTLFLCNYPGSLSPDSIDQIVQLTRGVYSNHHPFWHTMIIKACVSFGMAVFHDMNAAVACYSIFQIIVISACFTFALTTLCQAGVPAPAVALLLICGAVMPYNIIYSFTMWKDVLFGGMCLVLIVSLYRIIYGIGSDKFNTVSLFWSCLGMCLLRSNGFFSFACSVIVFFAFFRTKYIRILGIFIIAAVIAFAMKYPLLKELNVSQPSVIESISIPLQQIARVLADGREITAGQRELLGKIMDVDAVPASYKRYISDPVKILVYVSGHQDYLLEHKGEYLKLWFEIGMKFPREYLKGWVDQTRGFWHGGYKYRIWTIGVYDSPDTVRLGIRPEINCDWAHDVRDSCLDAFMNNAALMPFVSIGFNFWLLAFFCCCNIINHRRTETFLAVPCMAIVVSLMIATPVFSEFRYAYALFVSLPFIILSSVYCLDSGKHKGETGFEGSRLRH